MHNDDDIDLFADDVDPYYRERELAKRSKAAEKEKRRLDYIAALCEQGAVVEHSIVLHADCLAKTDDLARDVASRYNLVDPIAIEGEVGEGWDITFIINGLADSNDMWDVEEEELQKMKQEWAAIGNEHGFRLVSVDGVDAEYIDDDSGQGDCP